MQKMQKSENSGKLIFRNDDVNWNTRCADTTAMYEILHSRFPEAELWACVTLFSDKSDVGSVYPNPPFKHKPRDFFYRNSNFYSTSALFSHRRHFIPSFVRIVSHGLWHLDHSDCPYALQEASILTSCYYLSTSTFVPPFNRYNQDTIRICSENGIELVRFEDGWKSLEHEPFDMSTNLWYFHSWQWNPYTFNKKIGELDVKNIRK